MEEKIIPDWLCETETYTPSKDTSRFAEKSTKTIINILSRMKINKGRDCSKLHPALKLFALFGGILLIALSERKEFIWLMAALVLVRMAFLSGEGILHVVKGAVGAGILSAFLVLPAILMSGSLHSGWIPVKVILSVCMVSIFSHTTEWNQMTAAMRCFFLPNMLIFILDITLKYIVLLGELCLSLLDALTLRSVGCNRKKVDAFGGILGVTFLKSREMSTEMYEAMEARGFDGEYYRSSGNHLHVYDFFFIIGCICVVALFFYIR